MHKQLAPQDGVGEPPSGEDGTCPTTWRQLPTSNPSRCVPGGCKPHVEWAPRASPEEATQWPVGLREWLIDAILCCEGDDQCQPGDYCVDSSQTPSWRRVGGAAIICIAAMQKDRRGRRRKNEPAVIHRSSFGEGEGGGLDSFILVPTYGST